MLRFIKSLTSPAVKRAVITSGLEVSAVLDTLGLSSRTRGLGAIFTLHHVRPRFIRSFHPNDILEITPEFLDEALTTLAARGYEFIRLEDVPVRLAGKGSKRPFACFTLDDGNRNNKTYAAAVFTRHNAPFTIFITKGFIEGTHSLWWETLEALLNKVPAFDFDFGLGTEPVPAATYEQKLAAFNRITDFVGTSDETRAVAQLDEEARRHGIDPLAITRDLTMRADELRALAENPLVSYGAHTVSHRGLARLPEADARRDIEQSVHAVEAMTGRKANGFAYTYGDARSVSARERQVLREIGLPIGVTTRPGVLTSDMAADTTALPRISLNGLYQKSRYVRALASGIPFRVLG
jgi:peptidoglycan/xylan/chitin deacetylase (PgdA/CDA1 family)